MALAASSLQPVGSPALIAALPGSSFKVFVAPPFEPSGPSFGSPLTSPAPALLPHWPEGTALWPSDVGVAPPQFGPEAAVPPVTIVFCILIPGSGTPAPKRIGSEKVVSSGDSPDQMLPPEPCVPNT